jgi:hypothetical protein
MLVVTFLHSTSIAYGAAVQIAIGAPHYGVLGTGRGTMHVAGFEPTREDAARALALLNLIREWKGVQAWCRGKQLIGHWNILKVLDCYLAAESCADWRAHCVVTVDLERAREQPGGGGMGLFIKVLEPGQKPPTRPPPVQDYRAFPCRLAQPFFRFDPRHPSSYADQAQASVVRQGCDWCPRFDPSITGRVTGD